MRRKIHRSPRNVSPVHRRVFRPVLGWLEARTLLSTITWASDVSGDWDDPAMWGGAVPGPGDDAVISFSDITVTHDSSAARHSRQRQLLGESGYHQRLAHDRHDVSVAAHVNNLGAVQPRRCLLARSRWKPQPHRRRHGQLRHRWRCRKRPGVRRRFVRVWGLISDHQRWERRVYRGDGQCGRHIRRGAEDDG